MKTDRNLRLPAEGHEIHAHDIDQLVRHWPIILGSDPAGRAVHAGVASGMHAWLRQAIFWRAGSFQPGRTKWQV